MSTVTNKQLESAFGFKSTGFTVDNQGNITARSLVETQGSETFDLATPANFTITENGSNTAYIWTPGGESANITIYRGESYIIDLTSLTNAFYLYDGATQYHTGLTHSDGGIGSTALGKTSGRLVFAVSSTAPNSLTYRNLAGTVTGSISIEDPIGSFTTVTVKSTNVSTASNNGALIVTGGMGVGLASNFAGRISAHGGITGDLTGSLYADDSTLLVDSTSGNIVGPINTTTINNTTIGATTPSTAAFTSATVANTPTTDTSLANKKYVDETIPALAIALGT
tara:strand:+ start:3100 stop:3948 length:849 start_codon:yes stop_codon:yes gene_type:complete